jgi:hypothetical protein
VNLIKAYTVCIHPATSIVRGLFLTPPLHGIRDYGSPNGDCTHISGHTLVRSRTKYGVQVLEYAEYRHVYSHMAGCAGQNFIVEIRRSGTKRHQNLNLIFLFLNEIKKMAHFFRASMVRR